uniref:Uncharacterized protein n=1 Tax=Aegilops tauschii subsp. strangulata TaxID=200361 RepID=A0A453T1T7_AEGTS
RAGPPAAGSGSPPPGRRAPAPCDSQAPVVAGGERGVTGGRGAWVGWGGVRGGLAKVWEGGCGAGGKYSSRPGGLSANRSARFRLGL